MMPATLASHYEDCGRCHQHGGGCACPPPSSRPKVAWVGETKPDPAVLAEAIRVDQNRHAFGCPKRSAFALDCTCPMGVFL